MLTPRSSAASSTVLRADMGKDLPERAKVSVVAPLTAALAGSDVGAVAASVPLVPAAAGLFAVARAGDENDSNLIDSAGTPRSSSICLVSSVISVGPQMCTRRVEIWGTTRCNSSGEILPRSHPPLLP